MNKSRRFKRLFPDGMSLIVAMDHGVTYGPMKGIERLKVAVERVSRGGADAVMVSVGSIKSIEDVLSPSISVVATVFDREDVVAALKLGADGVKTTYFGEVPLPSGQAVRLREVAREADDWGVPYLIEVVPVDERGEVVYEPRRVALSARVGAELGGDVVKVPYTGDPRSFREVVEGCPIPVVIMGGPKLDRQDQVLSMVREAVDAGGAGVAFGRNVWGTRTSKE